MLSNLPEKVFLIILLLFFSFGSFAGSYFLINRITPSPPQISELFFTHPQLQKSKTITIILVGDIMLDRGVEYMMEKHNDWRFPFLKIANDFKKADILFGNLEGPVSDKGTKVGSIYSFRANPKAIQGLTYAGFDVLSLANNHIFDYGREAMEDTFSNLREADIDYVGAGSTEKQAHSPIIKEIRGTKIAFLAYTNLGSESWEAKGEKSGIAWLREEKFKEDIAQAKSQADLVIVSFHFGEEYQIKPNLTQKYYSQLAIDSGADLIVGHHPHVVQPIEQYKQGWIAYSLGNFVFDQNFSEETMQGQILEVSIEDSKIKEVIPKEIKINNFFQPEII